MHLLETLKLMSPIFTIELNKIDDLANIYSQKGYKMMLKTYFADVSQLVG